MKKTILLLFLLLLSFTANAQTLGELSVSSFTRLNQDMSARVIEPKKDQNGELAAIIKVITNERGLVFDVGMQGVVEAVQKTGEVWVYVPHSINRISINHPNYKKLSNYSLPESIDQATVYELELDVINRENFGGNSQSSGMALDSQYFVINYTPADINVEIYVDDEYVTTASGGSFSQLLKRGSHTYRLISPGYNNQAGRIVIGAERASANVDMYPAAGFINFTSTPISGASVYIDGELAGTTPFKSDLIAPGEHTVRAIMDLYKPFSQVINVPTDGKSIDVPITLSANYATVSITCADQASRIFVNNVERGGSNSTLKLIPGIYSIEARRDSYRSVFQSIEVVAGVDQNVKLAAPQPIYGALDISTTPLDAEITIDGDNKGKTPNMIGNLLIGSRSITISKEGYENYTTSVTIAEGEVAQLDVTLEKKPLYNEAEKYRKAAEKGSKYSQCSLGICYEFGDGVPQSYTEAAKWYRKSAEQGWSIAQRRLAEFYEQGKGVNKSKKEAIKWYRKAAELGDEDAIDKLRELDAQPKVSLKKRYKSNTDEYYIRRVDSDWGGTGFKYYYTFTKDGGLSLCSFLGGVSYKNFEFHLWSLEIYNYSKFSEFYSSLAPEAVENVSNLSYRADVRYVLPLSNYIALTGSYGKTFNKYTNYGIAAFSIRYRHPKYLMHYEPIIEYRGIGNPDAFGAGLSFGIGLTLAL